MSNVFGEVASAVGAAAFGGSNQQQGGQPGEPPQPGESIFKASNHPTALMFHLGFKTAALVMYILGGLISSSFVFSFVIVTLLLAFDFWTVKNVTGRLLVGLRWWNEVNEDGTNEWRFESREDTSRIADIDSRVFWLTLWVTPLVWSLFMISTLLSFNWGWLLCTVVANVLSAANLYGYVRCSRAAKDKVGSLATSVAAGMFSQGLSSRFGGGAA
eukprot:CAMPEP_0173439112 /NCGR_PEP_ID=MMETSP1357-20121228/20773_1 /TAXON_ID=77926 /ORGANISM="Hemiselmis rufescens, Strain PCC563" /LENGTH=214 /DNA_ID=CAMNT_0014404449 /DNA_START=5 /DNA_END=646 /DNA_ORIENTATION=-